MTRFEATNESEDTIPAPPEEVWAVLTDADLLARLTPLVDRIDVDGDHWRWHMAGISALGVSLAPSFRELMRFEDDRRICFEHDPPEGGSERAGADGRYELEGAGDGTNVSIHITIHVDLPLPARMAPAVERVMRRSMERTGDAFARNLLDHLGVG